MKLSDIVPYIVIPSLAFYGVVYDSDWAITAIAYYCYFMVFLYFVAIYFIDFTDKGYEYIKKAKLSDRYGTLKQKFSYVSIIATSALMVNYDHVIIGIIMISVIIVNEYIAWRIINANK